MQLQEILFRLATTPIHFQIIMSVSFLLTILSIATMFKSAQNDNDTGLKMSIISLVIFFFTAIGVAIYSSVNEKSAMQSAKITRAGDKIHIESNSEFMRSVDLDVLAEKDGYIVVEFENKTYRIEDLSKKGN